MFFWAAAAIVYSFMLGGVWLSTPGLAIFTPTAVLAPVYLYRNRRPRPLREADLNRLLGGSL